jgi:hypothetical protein
VLHKLNLCKSSSKSTSYGERAALLTLFNIYIRLQEKDLARIMHHSIPWQGNIIRNALSVATYLFCRDSFAKQNLASVLVMLLAYQSFSRVETL